MNIEALKSKIQLKAGQTSLVISKASPDILLAGGIVAVVAGAILACKATLRARDIYEETKENIEFLKQASSEENDSGDVVTEEETVRTQTIMAVGGAIEITKLYLPAAIVMGAGVAALVGSRNILTKRNAGILAALRLTQEAYDKYRERVLEEFGEEGDLRLRSEKGDDHEPYILSYEDDKGKIKKANLDPIEAANLKLGVSQYAKFFDESSPQWRQSPEANLFFLKAQQTNMNVTLSCRGHVFLNEVYDALGLPRTKAGAVVGWVKGNGDDIIDFGLFNGFNADGINGYGSGEILLDFNVDGVILDLI